MIAEGFARVATAFVAVQQAAWRALDNKRLPRSGATK
jgi:hypothetical protein